MRIRKPSDTRLREESATVLLPSLTFASFQWLDSHDAKRFTAIKGKVFFFLFQGLAFAVVFP